jgi:GT2 family glycosyltransferase
LIEAAPAKALDDLAVIIVSANSAHWLRACLRSVFDHAGSATLDVVVADNASTDGSPELVEGEFPMARVVRCRNLGFAYGNNRALMTCNARYTLFLNPDTEILEGTFGDLLRALDTRPDVGLVGVKQMTPDGHLYPTIRWFPNTMRALGDSLGLEHLPLRRRWMGERELNLELYELESECDWTTGSFMLARREAIDAAGFFDERFFMYAEETDLCLRIRQAGWAVRHLPQMTILHHGHEELSPTMEAQQGFARVQYARKHFSRVQQLTYASAVALGYALRAAAARSETRRAGSRQALRTIVGRAEPPFGEPPPQAVAPRHSL